MSYGLGPFRVGDSPAAPILLELDPETDLEAYQSASASLLGASRGLVASLGTALISEDGTVSFAFPANPFQARGIYTLAVKLQGAAGALLSLDEVPIVVDSETGWHTLASARAEWHNALDDVVLFRLLEIAREQCEAFAPEGFGPGHRARQAQLMQARNLLNASKTDPAQSADGDLFIIRPFPLDNFIKDLLRPRKAVRWVG